MSGLPTIHRASAQDSCPGALTVHQAADGGLARVRVPGGVVTAGQWRVLVDAAADLGDGNLDLTSRGNVQLRALPAGAEVELAARLADAGLLPSESHERVRNLIASPLTGRDRLGLADLRPLIMCFDRALLARPALTELSGRFLFALDDGRGDVASLAADLTILADSADEATLLIAGMPTRQTTLADAVGLMLTAAEAFIAENDENGWRIAEMRDGPARIMARLPGSPASREVPVGAPAAIGLSGSNLVVGVPLGRLTAAQATALNGHDLILTPWRSIVLPDLDDADSTRVTLEHTGLITDPTSPWLRVTACTGRPGCAKALADVRSDATAAVGTTTEPTHWSGCQRRCGKPKDAMDMLATETGYLRNGVPAV